MGSVRVSGLSSPPPGLLDRAVRWVRRQWLEPPGRVFRPAPAGGLPHFPPVMLRFADENRAGGPGSPPPSGSGPSGAGSKGGTGGSALPVRAIRQKDLEGPLQQMLAQAASWNIADMADVMFADQERSISMLTLLLDVARKLDSISNEDQLYRCLVEAIRKHTPFGDVLVYKRYIQGERARDGTIASGGELHAVAGSEEGGTYDPAKTHYPPHLPPRLPPEGETWAVTIKEGEIPGPDRTLLQLIQDPAADPRCSPAKVKTEEKRYVLPHAALPLIGDEKARGILAIWAREKQTFDLQSCLVFIAIAQMVMVKLSSLWKTTLDGQSRIGEAFSIDQFLQGAEIVESGDTCFAVREDVGQHHSTSELNQLLEWVFSFLLPIYEGTSIAEGKTRSELCAALEFGGAPSIERLNVKYVAIVLNEERTDGVGIVTGAEIAAAPAFAFKVPWAMIQKVARGSKAQVKVVYEFFRRYRQHVNSKLGFWRYHLRMLFGPGIYMIASTPSKRVIRDMLHFEGLSFPVEGMFPDETQRKLISLSSKGRADEKTGIEKTAYAGTIAIKEEEPDDFVFRTPGMIERAARALLVVIPLLSWISHLRRFAYKTDDFNQRLNAAFKSMGPRDRIHVVGRVTHGVVIKTALELLFSRLRPRRRPHRT